MGIVLGVLVCSAAVVAAVGGYVARKKWEADRKRRGTWPLMAKEADEQGNVFTPDGHVGDGGDGLQVDHDEMPDAVPVAVVNADMHAIVGSRNDDQVPAAVPEPQPEPAAVPAPASAVELNVPLVIHYGPGFEISFGEFMRAPYAVGVEMMRAMLMDAEVFHEAVLHEESALWSEDDDGNRTGCVCCEEDPPVSDSASTHFEWCCL